MPAELARELTRMKTGGLRRWLPLGVTAGALLAAFTRPSLGSVLHTASAIPAGAGLLVVLALLAGQMLAAWRLRLIAEDFHQRLTFGQAVTAMACGQLAGTFFFQVIGQTIARSAVLSRAGVAVPATITITGYERLVAAGVSFLLAIAGAAFLFGKITIDLVGGGAELLTILLGIILVAISGAAFAWGEAAAPLLRSALSLRSLRCGARAFLLSLGIQSTTMAAYAAAALALDKSIPLDSLLAATTLVMLAASVPISFAGWGLREISAVYALGHIGLPNAAALVVALLIGLASILTTAGIAIVTAWRRDAELAEGRGSDGPRSDADYMAFLSRSLPLFTASAVFFQIYVPEGTGRLNVNLADTIILFGGALLLLRLHTGRESVASRLPGLGIFLAAMSAVIGGAFLHGWYSFGLTSWALTNRLFGWLVLLCYGATGALLVLQDGESGRDLLLRSFVSAGLAVAALQALFVLAQAAGLHLPAPMMTIRVQGFAQNANAFAFQLLLVIAALLALGPLGRGGRLGLALAFLVLIYTVSRAGIGTCLVLCLAAGGLGLAEKRSLAIAGTLALAGVALISALQYAGGLLGPAAPQLAILAGEAADNAERWRSITAGLEMFRAHPIFGAGLGAFVESFTRGDGEPLIIHSTPVWLLAETGLVGLLVFAAPFLLLLYRELRGLGRPDRSAVLLICILLAFGVMSQAHELLFQRGLWLLLGAGLVRARPRMQDRRPAAAAETRRQRIAAFGD